MTPNRCTPHAAIAWFLRILAVCIPILMSVHVAQGETVKGTIGTKDLKGSDIPGAPPNGVGLSSKWNGWGWDNPGVAGCHIEVPNDPKKKGRVFGESCEKDAQGRTTRILIETTPGHDGRQPHTHTNDVGHPLRVDCARWCVEERKGKFGLCQPLPANSPNNKCAAPSARCLCTN